jgi:crotonobetainyl-CoA:carnitine CoA-transferase CaiB-like acyl-CoA transferase
LKFRCSIHTFTYHEAVELISVSHGEARVKRRGNQIGALCPAGIFKAATGYLWIFAFQENHWAKLCEITGREELLGAPHFADNTLRVANRAEVNKVIDAWLATFTDIDAAIAVLREAWIPHAPVLTVEQAMLHPDLIERRTVRTVHDRILGDFQLPGFPLRFSAYPESLIWRLHFLESITLRFSRSISAFLQIELHCSNASTSSAVLPTDLRYSLQLY